MASSGYCARRPFWLDDRASYVKFYGSLRVEIIFSVEVSLGGTLSATSSKLVIETIGTD